MQGGPRSSPLNVLFVCSFFDVVTRSIIQRVCLHFWSFCVLICIDIFFLLSIKPAGWGMCYRRVCFHFFFHSARSFPLFTLVFCFFFMSQTSNYVIYFRAACLQRAMCGLDSLWQRLTCKRKKIFLCVICWNCTEGGFLLLTPHTVDLIFIVEKGTDETTPITLMCKRIHRSYYRNI